MLLLTATILAETTTRLRPRLRALIGVGLLVTRLRPAAFPIEAHPLYIGHNRVSGAQPEDSAMGTQITHICPRRKSSRRALVGAPIRRDGAREPGAGHITESTFSRAAMWSAGAAGR